MSTRATQHWAILSLDYVSIVAELSLVPAWNLRLHKVVIPQACYAFDPTLNLMQKVLPGIGETSGRTLPICRYPAGVLDNEDMSDHSTIKPLSYQSPKHCQTSNHRIPIDS